MRSSKKIWQLSLVLFLSVCLLVSIILMVIPNEAPPEVPVDDATPSQDIFIDIPPSNTTNADNTTQNPVSDESDRTAIIPVTIDIPALTEAPETKEQPPVVTPGTVSTETKAPSVNPTPIVTEVPGTQLPPKDTSIVIVDPEKPKEPESPSGITPQESDWIAINPEIPKQLYEYPYTVNKYEILTGKQLEYRGFRDWDKAAEAARGALTTYYTVDYRTIGSTDPKDKAEYLRSLVYWVGESAQYAICDYMQFVKDNKIISKAEVVTDGSLIYNNGVRLIRARIYVTFESGASAYGLENGTRYYKDVEVAVYAFTGEDRYGYGPGAEYQALLFSDNCFNNLCEFKQAEV